MKLLIGGDLCITEDSWNLYNSKGIAGLFSPSITKLFNDANASLLNIECPMTESNFPVLKCGPNHKTTKQSASIVEDLGLTHASLANNHILDFGDAGIDDTVEVLKKRSIHLIGIQDDGYNQIIKQNGISIGIISFADDEFNGLIPSQGRINIYDPLVSFDQIRELKQQCDYVVVLFHSGLEHYQYPTPYIQRICRKMVECGANFVSCQHSHCIGAFENIDGNYILYGQGNFCFYRKSNISLQWNSSILVELNFDAEHMLPPVWHFAVTEDGLMSLSEENSDIEKQFKQRSLQCKDVNFLQENFENYCERKMKIAEIQFLRGSSNLKYYFDKITKGRFIDYFLPQKKTIGMSNTLRCTVHNEVIRCILLKKNFGNGRK